MIASGGLSGGLSSSIAGGSFADGFRQGIITSGLNHAMHQMSDDGDIDPPGKKKSITQKLKSNSDKISEAGEAFLSAKQIKMIDAREGLAVKDKIGTFGKFASKYSKYAKAAKVLGKVNNIATAYNSFSDVRDYNNGNLSGARLSYRLGSTAATIVTSSAVGGEFGGPWGVLAGFVVGSTTSVGEFIYDGWNNSVMPVINQGTYQINNNQAWTNFHP